MRFLLSIVSRAACILLIAGSGAAAAEHEFRHSRVLVSVGQSNLDRPLVYRSERFRRLTTAELEASAQVLSNVALGFSTRVAAADRQGVDVSELNSTAFAKFPFAINELSVIPKVGYSYMEAEACQWNLCARNSESALMVGVEGRLWLVPGRWELFGGYTDYTSELFNPWAEGGIAYWWTEQHRVHLRYREDRESHTLEIGYGFQW